MTPAPKRRRLRFGLRGLFVTVTAAGILTALLVRSWQRVQERREYVNHAGAVNGHADTMQGYSSHVNRWKLTWWLFSETDVEQIWLYPGYSEEELKHIRGLFPEAKITDYERGN